MDSFAILSKSPSNYHLKLLEAINILSLKPTLCKQKDFVLGRPGTKRKCASYATEKSGSSKAFGTRLIVKKMLPHLLEAEILTGSGKEKRDLIPKIPLIPPDLPFEFKRLQFPMRVSCAISINKSQGQSLEVTGLHLMDPCFSYGQLYVGCSKVGNGNKLFVLTPNGKTKNHAALQ